MVDGNFQPDQGQMIPHRERGNPSDGHKPVRVGSRVEEDSDPRQVVKNGIQSTNQPPGVEV